MVKKTIFSGIQPSGDLHVGNYIGMIRQSVNLQESGEFSDLIFCVVDLHAITVFQDPKVLREKNLELSALYLAGGIDPNKSKLFIQSENPDHTYLAWIFDCFLNMGQLFRMTQFKEKAQKFIKADNLSSLAEARALFEGPVGLFNYPALMAADILLYDTNVVPVGEDQRQHVELTRDIAEKFNKQFGEIFVLPETRVDRDAARIMSLQNPLSKMSKSDKDPLGTINILNTPDEIREKIKKAVTDSGSEVVFKEDKPAISNLLVIYSRLSGKPVEEIEKQYQGIGYGQFKSDLAEVVVGSLKKIQEKYQVIKKDEGYLNKVLNEGRDFSLEKSSQKIKEIKRLMGLGR
ncbi:MAG: tryptophan--tRNA ligase [Candidatus Roizmanbacteria bacterium]|nr:MAG: tryptophan--tRNA ligase [Candidatus Roizmanbacteria bacterium]